MSSADAGVPTDAVLVVGAGPVGATTALLLANRGIAVRIIERRAQPQAHPAAHVISTRTMEIWRTLGIDQDVLEDSAPIEELQHVAYCRRLTDPDIGRVAIVDPDWPGFSDDPYHDIEALSPSRAAHFSQNRLEPLLWKHLDAAPNVEFHRSCRYVEHQATEGGLSVSVERGDGIHSLSCSYLVAADGAASRVRRRLGIEMDGPILQHMVSVHFSAEIQHLLVDRPAPVIWTHTPRGVGGLIVHRAPDDLVFQFPYFPPARGIQDFTWSHVRRRIADAIGDDTTVRIKSVQSWAMTAQVAEAFRRDRVFLVGDAAHRFPPTGGLGLNTGVADAHNLAWKLDWVCRYEATPELLDTYETERRPVAIANTAHSVHNYEGMTDVLAAMGLDPAQSEKLQEALARPAAERLPRIFLKVIVDLLLFLGMQRLRRLGVPGRGGERVRASVRAAIANQGPHYRSWGQDLGVIYAAGALVSDGRPSEIVDIEYYTPIARAGGRLPHLWSGDPTAGTSTHDLVNEDTLTILANDDDRVARWRRSTEGIEPDVVLADVGRQWADVGLANDDALIVRPDGVIVDILHDPTDTARLDNAIRSVVGAASESIGTSPS